LRQRRAFHHDGVEGGHRGAGQRRAIGGDGFSDHAVVPSDKLAGGIEARLDVMRGHRAELAGRDIVLAAPDHLDGLAHRLGKPHGIERHILRPAAAAIAAADQLLVQRDVRTIGAEELGHVVEQSAHELGADPDLRRLAVGRN